jgi:dihydroorotate dehydrogenase (fumarate)
MNLTTRWLGLELKNPFVPSSSPLSRSLDLAKRLEDAGAGAIVMYSLFEEAVRADQHAAASFVEHSETSAAKSEDPLATGAGFPGHLDRYLERLAAMKASLEIPIVASLNGITASGWMQHARDIEEAGADALELNAYYLAGDVWEEGHYVEQRYVTLLKELRLNIGIPINMKLSPFFSSIGNMVKKFEANGVAGVSLFNRFYQPDIDIDGLRLQHTLTPTTSADALLAMRWIAILQGRVGCSLGATGGVHTGEDVIKLLLAGADVVHLCHCLLQHGADHIGTLRIALERWMMENGHDDLGAFRGRMSQASVLDPSDYERLNYIRVIEAAAKAESERL